MNPRNPKTGIHRGFDSMHVFKALEGESHESLESPKKQETSGKLLAHTFFVCAHPRWDGLSKSRGFGGFGDFPRKALF